MKSLTYLGNVMNTSARSFYLEHGVTSVEPAYEIRIRDWSSDVCSSDLEHAEEVIAISKSFNIDAKIVGRIEESGDLIYLWYINHHNGGLIE